MERMGVGRERRIRAVGVRGAGRGWGRRREGDRLGERRERESRMKTRMSVVLLCLAGKEF